MRGAAWAVALVAAVAALRAAPRVRSTPLGPTIARAVAAATPRVAAPAVAAAPSATVEPAPVVVEPPPATRPEHVIIISEDGMRPDALTEDLAPTHVALMRESTVARAARTIPQSDTLPSHASMLSGFPPDRHGLRWNSFKPDRGFIHVPTVFSIAHRAGMSTAMIVGKPKLRHIAPEGTVGHFERPSYLCGGVSKRAAAYFTAKQPRLLFIHFSDPDEYGHSHGWMSDEYRRAVANSDRCLATVLAALDASGLADRTLVIVTADHGGHGHQHSRRHDDLERQIPWIARGPGAGENQRVDTPVSTMDTAATVLAALRLPPAPGSHGVPVLRY